MATPLRLLLIIICLNLTTQTKADSWVDPTWKIMLDSSDIIALVQYSSNGDFRASANILTIYKGHLKKGDEIWISGFSNHYGPIDKMNKGDKYLVFLHFNRPDDKRIKYLNEELKEHPELRAYADAYKNYKAYYVWSPTSGDLKIREKMIQYDLIQTSFYEKQNYYSLNEFEYFLLTYLGKSNKNAFCQSRIERINPVTESDMNSQYLMQLFLLDYSQYDNIFESYVKVNNPSSKYALAQLMGNIKTAESRNILINLLNDKHSFVQGEVVRQLKKEQTEIVAPILLQHIKNSSGTNFGPSNIMNPVMNRIDGGKFEIIKTLGELKYKPAIPDLLLFLDTENDVLFELVIDALKNIGSRDYIPYINKHLYNKTHKLIFKISMMIAKDSLVECLPSFKNFIATCNRNRHPNYEFTISNCCGIGNFNDSSTVAFLLSDYNHFLTYKDTLESSKQNDWTQEYIQTFANLRVKEARPLIYKSIFDWFGLNEDFGKNPKLFEVKRHLEDSMRTAFANGIEKKGYKLNYCIAFIENTSEVVNGTKPRAKYLIQVTIPSTDKGNEHLGKIAGELNLPKESIYMRFSDGAYYISIQQRFDKNILSTPLYKFLNYAEAIPNSNDLLFLQELINNNFINDGFYQKMIKGTIDEIKIKLNR